MPPTSTARQESVPSARHVRVRRTACCPPPVGTVAGRSSRLRRTEFVARNPPRCEPGGASVEVLNQHLKLVKPNGSDCYSIPVGRSYRSATAICPFEPIRITCIRPLQPLSHTAQKSPRSRSNCKCVAQVGGIGLRRLTTVTPSMSARPSVILADACQMVTVTQFVGSSTSTTGKKGAL
jgi:hypothetical protein